jgi:ABC-type lipoprotein release transport system permease subunit
LLGGVTMATTLLAAVLFATTALKAETERARGTQPDLVVQRLVGGRPSLIDPAAVAFVAAMPGIRRVEPRVWGYVFLPSLRANVTVVARRDERIDLGAVGGALMSGRDARPGEHGAAVIGKSLADLLRVRVGDVMSLPSADLDAPALTVVGIFDSPVALYTSDVVLVPTEDARAILGVPTERATDIAIDLVNPEEATVVTRAIFDKEPDLRILDKRVISRTYQLTYGRRAGVVLAASLPALLVMLLLAWDKMTGTGPSERREIAVEKAVGWSTADVLYAKLYESVLVGVLGFGAGIVLAYGWVFVLDAPLLREVLSGWSVLYPGVPFTPSIDPADVAGLAAMVLAPFIAASIVPSWRAATVDPMQAMRT